MTDQGDMRLLVPRRRQARQARLGSIGALKMALPTAIIAAGAFLFHGWLEAQDRRIHIPDVPNPIGSSDITASSVFYDGRDSRGRFVSISADAASHASRDDTRVNLTNPVADIVLSSGAYVAVIAKGGLLDRSADIIALDGDVTLFHDNGLSFQTNSATIDLDGHIVQGAAPVEGQKGHNTLVSQGFRVSDDGDTVTFTGKARMAIYPKQKGIDG